MGIELATIKLLDVWPGTLYVLWLNIHNILPRSLKSLMET